MENVVAQIRRVMFQLLYSTFIGYQATKKIQRFITRVRIVLGQGPNKATKLQIFKSRLETQAGQNVDGTIEIIDIKSNPVLEKVILEKETVVELMGLKGNPFEYVKKYRFQVSCMWKGSQRFFMYRPSEMTMAMEYTKDYKIAANIKKNADFEKSCNEFVAMAQRNARALAVLGKQNLSAVQKTKLAREIVEHKALIYRFRISLPPGYNVEIKELTPNQVNKIGLITVIIWIVIIIVSGVVVALTVKNVADVAKHKATLDDRYKSIMAIADPAVRNAIIKETIKADTKARATEADKPGFLTEVKQILIIGVVAYGIKELLPLFKKTK